MKKNSKILPFKLPRVCTYPYFTSILAILEGNNDADVWLFNNYILFWMLKDVHHIDYWVDFKYGNELIQEEFCPNIEKEQIKRQSIKVSISEYMIRRIDEGIYVMPSVNCKYINSWWKKDSTRRNFRHQFLVYGYDKERAILYVADFVGGRNYESFEVPFCEMEEGYLKYDEYVPNVEFGEDVFLLKYKQNPEYKIDIMRICDFLDDLVMSQDLHVINHIQTEHKADKYIYGIDVIKEIAKYALDIKKGVYNFFDIRAIAIPREMNKVMVLRIEYLINKGLLSTDETLKIRTEVKEAYSRIKHIELLIIKYNLTKREEILDSVIKKILEFANFEKEVMGSVKKTFMRIV